MATAPNTPNQTKVKYSKPPADIGVHLVTKDPLLDATWRRATWSAFTMASRPRLGRCIADAAISALACMAALMLSRSVISSATGIAPLLPVDIALILLYASSTVLCCAYTGLYTDPAKDRRAHLIAKNVAAATVLAMFFAALMRVKGLPVVAAGIVGSLNTAGLVGSRWVIRQQRKSRRRHSPALCRKVLIVGCGPTGRALAQFLQHNHHLGYSVAGFVDEAPNTEIPLLGTIQELFEVARMHFVDELLVTRSSDTTQLLVMLDQARKYHLNLRVVPEILEKLGCEAGVEFVSSLPTITLHSEPTPSQVALGLKRLFDLVVASFAIVPLLPLFALIAIAIKCDSLGPVIYRSDRAGKKGRTFVLYKFRTMTADADALKEDLRLLNERQGMLFKIRNDPRVTRFGRWLRTYSIDELPQLWNVVKGDMSLVGPRPPSLDEYKQYTLQHLARLRMTPGITGLWQVSARNDPSFDVTVKLDLQYIANWSLALDLKLLARTIPTVIRGTGC